MRRRERQKERMEEREREIEKIANGKENESVCLCVRERERESERERKKTDLLRPINQSACEKSYGFNKFWLNQLEPAPFENPKLKVRCERNGTFLRSRN